MTGQHFVVFDMNLFFLTEMSKKVKYLSYFQDDWLESFSWGKRDAMDNTISYCTLCKKSGVTFFRGRDCRFFIKK